MFLLPGFSFSFPENLHDSLLVNSLVPFVVVVWIRLSVILRGLLVQFLRKSEICPPRCADVRLPFSEGVTSFLWLSRFRCFTNRWANVFSFISLNLARPLDLSFLSFLLSGSLTLTRLLGFLMMLSFLSSWPSHPVIFTLAYFIRSTLSIIFVMIFS